MGFTTDSDDRKLGVVWRDANLTDQPATHVLIVGIGQFASPKLSPLQSTPASARALAGWFLDGARGAASNGFFNPKRPLASLALLLSEAKGGEASVYEGATVPRATFANVEKALRSWIDRAQSNNDSATVLAFFSHGQAEWRQTAILFEDYGTDNLNPYVGMTDSEQLVEALSTLEPRDKLVIFDCCRSTVDLGLPHQGVFGTRLIGGVPSAPYKRPQVMMSTQYDGESFGGRDGRPTLFTNALLNGLRGCAADADNLTISTWRLGGVTQEILGLWQEDNEPIQIPDTSTPNSFPITRVPNIDETTVFVTVRAPHDLTQTKIQVFEEEQLVSETVGHRGPDPFLRLILPSDRIHRVVATDAKGQLIGEVERKSRPPVIYRKFPDPEMDDVAIRTEQTRGFAGAQSPAVTFGSKGPLLGSELVTFQRRLTLDDASSDDRNEVLIRPNQLDGVHHDGFDLTPGDWTVSVSRPGQPRYTRSLRVKDGDTVRVDMPNPSSPHEWLANAVAAGIIRGSSRRSTDLPGSPAGLSNLTKDMSFKLKPIGATSRFALFEAKDEFDTRFRVERTAKADQAAWMEYQGVDTSGRAWRERAFVPLVGFGARFQGEQSWTVEVLIDNDPPPRGSRVAAYPVSKRWGPLIGFLGRRHFEDAGAMLRLLGANAVTDAVRGKVNEPLAAICGAMVAVATNQVKSLGIPEPWLENICNWFPTLPDGAVILARYRLETGQDVGALLEEALRRGVPVTSLAIDWLSEALTTVGHPQAAAMRDMAMACDPIKAFTVLRRPPEGP